jgi:hypothetical protein
MKKWRVAAILLKTGSAAALYADTMTYDSNLANLPVPDSFVLNSAGVQVLGFVTDYAFDPNLGTLNSVALC